MMMRLMMIMSFYPAISATSLTVPSSNINTIRDQFMTSETTTFRVIGVNTLLLGWLA
jgi:hypothetical protein